MKTAIVLSGGGGKGAYQIGVWKALRKLGINYDIVTGTSVGALNGVLMVQQDYHEALALWSNIDYSFIFNQNFSNINKNIYVNYIKEFIKDGGMDITNLENALNKIFDSKRFYSSPIDFGIVVYNLSKFKEELLIKKDLQPETIKDYIIASATCYPAFKIKKINSNKYIDGGYYDNLPINLAISLGADRIIAVDLKAPGIRRKTKNSNKEIINICPNNDIGSFLQFDKFISRRNIRYGYNDTLKVFHKLEGHKFSFNKQIYKFFIKRIANKFYKNLDLYLNSSQSFGEQIKMIIPKLILNKSSKDKEKQLLDTLEFLGYIFKLDDYKIYFLNNYNYIIKKRFKKMIKVDERLIKDKIYKKDFSSLLGSKYIVKYIYQILKDKEKYLELYSLIPIFKKEFLAAIYLITIGC